MSDRKKKFEGVVKEFGNGAHVIVPRKLKGQIIQIETVCSYVPPLFKDIEIDKTVFMTISTNEDERKGKHGLDKEEEDIKGEVIEHEVDVNDEVYSSEVVVDEGTNFYKVEIERKAGDEGWEENKYTVYRDITDDEIKETNKVIEWKSSGMWKQIGTLEGLAVKNRSVE